MQYDPGYGEALQYVMVFILLSLFVVMATFFRGVFALMVASCCFFFYEHVFGDEFANISFVTVKMLRD
jgi:hypothetical protein